jgi:ABC-type sugar transport system ATPase subunit
MAEVVLQNVTKVYPRTGRGRLSRRPGGGAPGADGAAVRDLSLAISDGEFIVLVGPSGCGKTTTLRMIAGLEEVTGGTVSIGGRVVNDVHPRDRDIAMVFQNYALT